MKKILLLLLLTLFGFSESIEKYLVDLYINKDGSLRVVEDIKYNFQGSMRHGIYRDIPKNDTIIKDINAWQNKKLANFKVIKSKDYIRIRIGDANRYVSGLVEYKISYTISGYVVRNSGDINQIIVDLIGTGWRVPIKYAKAVVYLPKILIGNVKVKVFSGKFGSKRQIDYKVNYNKIIITAHNLPPHNGITIELDFDKSLIKESSKPSILKNPIYYLFLIPIIALFYYFGKKFEVFKSIGSIAPRYRPPKDLTLLESAVLKDNFLEFNELKAAILELANLGYIKIKNIDGILYLEKSKKDTSALSNAQKLLLNAIFGDTEFVNVDNIKLKEEEIKAIKDSVHNSLIKKGYFYSSVRMARSIFLYTAAIVALFSLGAFLFYIFKDTGFEYIFPVIITSIFIIVGFSMLFSAIKDGKFFETIFAIAWIGFSSLFLYGVVYSKSIFIAILFMMAIVALGVYYIYRHMNTLSFKGFNQKRYMLGLKEFIKTAQKDKIDYFLKEDKKYLDKLLPYAMLFGLNEHWLHLYKELNAQLPEWYEGDLYSFDNLDLNISYFEPPSSNPSIDSADFGSFGGFSGGGVGGGGGGSW